MLKMTTLKQIREAIHPGQWVVSLDIKAAYCYIPIARRHHCFLCFRLTGKIYQFKTLPFGLSSAPKTFMRVLKSILLQYRKMAITVFLYLGNALVLAIPTLKPRKIGRVWCSYYRLGFVLSLKMCQLLKNLHTWAWCPTHRI